MQTAPPRAYNSSLSRGLEILSLIQESGRLRVVEVSRKLEVPLSTVYRYVTTLRDAGFVVEVDGLLMPSAKLAASGNETEHLVRYAAPVLRRLREASQMTALLTVRTHLAAVSLEVSFANPKYRISFRRGDVRALTAGASALPLLAFAPQSVIREALDGELLRYTSATPDKAMVEQEIEQIRRVGYAVSVGHLTPGMKAIGVPVIVDGHCICALSLVGEVAEALPVDRAVELLRAACGELLREIPSSIVEESWLNTHA